MLTPWEQGVVDQTLGQVRRRFPVWSRGREDDVRQVATLKLLDLRDKRQDREDPGRNWSGYCQVAVTRHTLRYARRQARDDARATGPVDRLPYTPHMSTHQTVIRVSGLIARLDKDLRAAVVETARQSSQAAAAVLLNISTRTLQRRLHKARAQLYEMNADEED